MFKNLIKTLIFFLLIVLFFSNAYSDEKLIDELKKGKKIIFIRHAIAPGNGDPDNFNINDCKTQRNLSEEGVEQSKNIGIFFEENKIKIDKILSSEWCRCKDTAKIAFNNFETFDSLNSFYDEKFAQNEDIQIQNLKKYIKSWKSDKNLILVTHFVVISSILNVGISSGEMIISDKNYNIIANKIF